MPGRSSNRKLAAAWYGVNFRDHPHLYQIGRGEQGVLTAAPYKSEILPRWRFRTPEIATESALKLARLYSLYREVHDYVGMDMTRKYVQMGFTRARRYTNHRSGKKYNGPVPRHLRGVSGAHGRIILPLDYDPLKAQCAKPFKQVLEWIKADPDYHHAQKMIWMGNQQAD